MEDLSISKYASFFSLGVIVSEADTLAGNSPKTMHSVNNMLRYRSTRFICHFLLSLVYFLLLCRRSKKPVLILQALYLLILGKYGAAL